MGERVFTRMSALLEFNQERVSYKRKASKTSTFTLSSYWVSVTRDGTGTVITQQYFQRVGERMLERMSRPDLRERGKGFVS